MRRPRNPLSAYVGQIMIRGLGDDVARSLSLELRPVVAPEVVIRGNTRLAWL